MSDAIKTSMGDAVDFGTIGAGTVEETAAAKATFHEVADGRGFAATDAGPLREGGRLTQAGGTLSGLHALKQD
jgi:predicted dinucleotide-binding enzyme